MGRTNPALTTILLLVTFLTGCNGWPGASDASGRTGPVAMPSQSELEDIVRPALEGKWAGGLVVGITYEGKTAVRGFGAFADHPNPGKVVFEIGSVTKTFTGLLLADAVVRGKAKLTDPAGDYLDFAIPEHKGKPILLVHLATHTSGLPIVPANFKITDPSNPYADYTREELAEFLTKYPLPRAPGARYDYSNLGMGLLADAMAKVNGGDLEAAYVERICEPLGLTDTRITATISMRTRLAPAHDSRLQPAVRWTFATMAGAGALLSTADDVLRYLDAQLNPETTPLAGAILLSQREHFREGDKGGKGLGWLIGRDESGVALDHAGQTGGYSAYVAIDPGRRLGIVVLSDTASPGAMGAGFALIERMWTGGLGKAFLPVAVRVPPEQLQRYVGTYRFGDRAIVAVTLNGTQLYIQSTGGPKLRMDPMSTKRFFLRDTPMLPPVFEFAADAAGRTTAIIGDPDGERIRAERIR